MFATARDVIIMATKKLGAFTGKAKQLLNTGRAESLADLLDVSHNTVSQNTEKPESLEDDIPVNRYSDITRTRKAEKPENQEDGSSEDRIREEVRLPIDLAEALRLYAFQQRMKKTTVMTQALREFLQRRGFAPQ